MEINKNIDVCCGCTKKVLKNSKNIRLALKQYWHEECFRCSKCDINLSDWYFESNQKKLILCRNDYLRLYSNHCQQCGEVLSGPFMSADEHKFHPECFQCVECGDPIGDGEEYILAERSKIFDRKCFENADNYPHTIQLIRVNMQHDNLLPIKFSSSIEKQLKSDIKISEIHEATNLNQKHIGDKVLEVNGVSTNGVSIDSISDIVCNSNKVLQLTIEHKLKKISGLQSKDIGVQGNESERLFKKKKNARSAYIINRKNVNCDTATNSFKAKERSSSMSKLLGPVNTPVNDLYDLARTKSFRVEGRTQRIFRPSDLVQGELLGKGFFGQVYKITEKISGEVMVLKELYRVDEDAQRNFLKEVAVLKSLNHSNVLRFIGVLYKNSKLHLITEFVPMTLNEIIHNTNNPLPFAQRVKFARDIATGMNYLHSKNIIHRDLNSFNCLVRENMSVIVADFGLARIISQPPRYSTSSKIINKIQNNKNIRHRKQRYTIVGNPYWMAPEMMKGNKYDEKVDVFSFGIVVCELIGRVQADPDFLPRSSDFGLNHEVFIEKFCKGCPEAFFLSAFVCCDLNPDKRPPFNLIEVWLKMLSEHTLAGSVDNSLKEVKNYILNNNISLPMDHVKSLDYESIEISEPDSADKSNDDSTLKNMEDSKFLNSNAQFFSRDFSETGERLRSSFRARRHKKSLQHKRNFYDNQQNNVLLCDTSESEPLSLIEITNEAEQELVNVEHTLNKVSEKLAKDEKLSQYSKDAFVIKVNDGVLSIKDIKNLECISDLDSSCDTSLNIIDSSLSGDNNKDGTTKTNPKFDAPLQTTKQPLENALAKTKKYACNKNLMEVNRLNYNRSLKTTEIKCNATEKRPFKKQIDQTLKRQPQTILKTDASCNKPHNNTKKTSTTSIKTPEKCKISEKMTESARAKIKVKVRSNSSKVTLSSTKNCAIQEKTQVRSTKSKKILPTTNL